MATGTNNHPPDEFLVKRDQQIGPVDETYSIVWSKVTLEEFEGHEKHEKGSQIRIRSIDTHHSKDNKYYSLAFLSFLSWRMPFEGAIFTCYFDETDKLFSEFEVYEWTMKGELTDLQEPEITRNDGDGQGGYCVDRDDDHYHMVRDDDGNPFLFVKLDWGHEEIGYIVGKKVTNGADPDDVTLSLAERKRLRISKREWRKVGEKGRSE